MDASYEFGLGSCFSTYLAGHRIRATLECSESPNEPPIVVYYKDSSCTEKYETSGGGQITSKMKDFEVLKVSCGKPIFSVSLRNPLRSSVSNTLVLAVRSLPRERALLPMQPRLRQ